MRLGTSPGGGKKNNDDRGERIPARSEDAERRSSPKRVGFRESSEEQCRAPPDVTPRPEAARSNQQVHYAELAASRSARDVERSGHEAERADARRGSSDRLFELFMQNRG